jgi:hypothetical protein
MLLCPEKYYVYVPSYDSNTHNDHPSSPPSPSLLTCL